MTNDDIISTLNDLIETCNDGEAGFKTCAGDTSGRHPQLKTLFTNRQYSCAQAANELKDLVRMAGGEPATGTTTGGALRRGWLNIKTSIIGKNDEAVLDECEKAEDAAAYNYKKALSQDLPEHIRIVVDRQYRGVLANHDEIKNVRDQVRVDA